MKLPGIPGRFRFFLVADFAPGEDSLASPEATDESSKLAGMILHKNFQKSELQFETKRGKKKSESISTLNRGIVDNSLIDSRVFSPNLHLPLSIGQIGLIPHPPTISDQTPTFELQLQNAMKPPF